VRYSGAGKVEEEEQEVVVEEARRTLSLSPPPLCLPPPNESPLPPCHAAAVKRVCARVLCVCTHTHPGPCVPPTTWRPVTPWMRGVWGGDIEGGDIEENGSRAHSLPVCQFGHHLFQIISEGDTLLPNVVSVVSVVSHVGYHATIGDNGFSSRPAPARTRPRTCDRSSLKMR